MTVSCRESCAKFITLSSSMYSQPQKFMECKNFFHAGYERDQQNCTLFCLPILVQSNPIITIPGITNYQFYYISLHLRFSNLVLNSSKACKRDTPPCSSPKTWRRHVNCKSVDVSRRRVDCKESAVTTLLLGDHSCLMLRLRHCR